MSALAAKLLDARSADTGAAERTAGTRTSRRTSATALDTVAPAKLAADRPTLTLVPRRRRAAWFAVVLSVLVAGLMLGSAVLHTQLAERQMRLDRLDQAVAEQQERFDVLRSQRAELRSPTRLAAEASALGMRPSVASAFLPVDGATYARAIAAVGEVPTEAEQVAALEPLDQFRLVKSVEADNP